MLAAGTRDSDTEKTVADMLIEIVHQVSTAVLKIVTPMAVERMQRSASWAVENTSVASYSIQLRDNLLHSFADTFQVPLGKCESAVK